MDFAKKQLEKYGWKEGEGLGKEGNVGISEPVKPVLKSGVEGIGFNLADDKCVSASHFAKIYEDSLKRLNVKSKKGKIIVSVDTNERDEDNRPIVRLKRQMIQSTFTQFTKGEVLENGQIIKRDSDTSTSSSSESEDDDKGSKPKKAFFNNNTKKFNLTDEELFKACRRKSSKKSYRFRHVLKAKLERLETQDKNHKLKQKALLEKKSKNNIEDTKSNECNEINDKNAPNDSNTNNDNSSVPEKIN